LKVRGFTLLEVLVVIIVISLFFSMLFGAYFFVVNKSLKTMKNSKRLYGYANALYGMKKAIECAKTIKIDNSKRFSKVYLYTYCGMYRGFSKEVFFVKDNILYVYAYPYVFGDIFFYDPKLAIKLIPVEKFRAKFTVNNFINLHINNNSFNIPTLIK